MLVQSNLSYTRGQTLSLPHRKDVEAEAPYCCEQLSVAWHLIRPVPWTVGRPVDQARAVAAGGDTARPRAQTSGPQPGVDGNNLQEVGTKWIKVGA